MTSVAKHCRPLQAHIVLRDALKRDIISTSDTAFVTGIVSLIGEDTKRNAAVLAAIRTFSDKKVSPATFEWIIGCLWKAKNDWTGCLITALEIVYEHGAGMWLHLLLTIVSEDDRTNCELVGGLIEVVFIGKYELDAFAADMWRIVNAAAAAAEAHGGSTSVSVSASAAPKVATQPVKVIVTVGRAEPSLPAEHPGATTEQNASEKSGGEDGNSQRRAENDVIMNRVSQCISSCSVRAAQRNDKVEACWLQALDMHSTASPFDNLFAESSSSGDSGRLAEHASNTTRATSSRECAGCRQERRPAKSK